MDKPTTLLDTRVPQPGREPDYDVPTYLIDAAAVLYRARNHASNTDVAMIDAAIMRLYEPYTRPASAGHNQQEEDNE